MYSRSSENKSFVKAIPSKVQSSSTTRTLKILETPSGPTFNITAFSDAKDFMNSPEDPAKVPGPSKARSTPRVDKIVERIWKQNSPIKQNENPIEVVYLDSSNSTGKQTEEVITLESTPNEDDQVVEAEPLATTETEEHEGGPPSSISDINPRDFHDPLEL